MIKQLTPQRASHLVIRASAGTGKTFQLSNRFLRLLYDDRPADQILAVTFTRKAAGEILDRVLLRLAEAATDEGRRTELAMHIAADDLSRERVLSMLHEATRNLHRLRISTLDSFFAQIAGTFALELGFPPGWRIVEAFADAQLRNEAIDSLLQRRSTRDLSTLMNLLTKGEVARSVRELLRSTVANLYAVFQETSLLESKQPEPNPLAADAPPNNAEAPGPAARAVGSHSSAWTQIPHPPRLEKTQIEAAIQSLRDFPVVEHPRLATAVQHDADVAQTGDWEQFIKKGAAGKIIQGDTTYYRKPIPPELIQHYQSLIDHAKAEFVGRMAFQTEASHQLLHHFDAEYQRLKQERRAMRFDDITVRLAQFAGDAAEQLAWRLDANVAHLLLDEFQDTSVLQWRVIAPFARRITASNDGDSFFCVGDVKQAIYGWRGGNAELFNSLREELTDLTEQPLDETRRCSGPVIETVNKVFSSLTEHNHLESLEPAVRRWSQGFRTHSTAREQTPGYVCLETSREKTEDDEDQQTVVLQAAALRTAEFAQQTPHLTIGVLVRKNSAVGKMIYLLRQAKVLASEEGGNPLVDSAAVELVLSLLRLADHPGDGPARFHVAHSPLASWLGFEDHTDTQAAETLAQDVRRLLMTHGYGRVIGLWADMLESSGAPRDKRRLAQLVELAYRRQTESTLRADDFVRLVEAERVSDPSAAQVRVMTVHQAKGLEFDIVVAPEWEYPLRGQTPTLVTSRQTPAEPIDRVCRYANEAVQGMLPEKFQKMFQESLRQDITEALCLLYVALTRPIHALHLFTAPSKQKKLPKTPAGLLRAALADSQPMEPERVTYECGDPLWRQRVPSAQPHQDEAQQPQGVIPRPLNRIKLASSRGRRRRGLDRKSPSSLEGGSHLQLADLFTRDRGTVGMEWGTVIHAWFEQITWLENGRPNEEALRRIALQTASPALDIDEMLLRFAEMLDDPQIGAALTCSSYNDLSSMGFSPSALKRLQKADLHLQVKNECPFAIRDKDDLLTGYIDRLVILHDGPHRIAADILDYKTDAVDESDPSDSGDDADKSFQSALTAKVKYYQPQIEAYRRAVAAMTGLKPGFITARLLFVGPKVVKVAPRGQRSSYGP